jgi:outer membrane lipoprotein-sorting protein
MTRPLPRRRAVLAAALALLCAAPATIAVAAPAASALSLADQALVDKATAYLQGLGQVQGRFAQTDARGAVTHGTVMIKRPGKARFDYDAPSGLVVASDGHNVTVYDQRLKTFDRYPLGSTPLSLFLAKNVRLDQGVVITRVARVPGGFTLTARDGRKQAEGQVTLTFSDDPLALREWTLTDAQGQTTRVSVEYLRPATLADSLFVIRDPRPRTGPR